MITGIQNGEEIAVSFNLSSREYNGKYYHNIDAWRIERLSIGNTSETEDMPEFNAPASEVDDLPF